MSADYWVGLSLAAVFALACIGVCVDYSRQERKCERLNREQAEHAKNWDALTDDDRAWLLANGAQRPSLIRWELR